MEILGHERRRRWRAEEKLAIVNSVGVDGATVTEVALRHDVSRQQIYMWRSELKRKGLLPASVEALFLPLIWPPHGLALSRIAPSMLHPR
ncbi:transposase [Ochrobactrum daejeonense]|nr:transposase [Brucella daejeonensis]NKB78932.1 transposase [Brucella daejeonensis]NKB79881.1 transposase [Brucella daejeonensis]